jgi:DNA-binding transcriptional regulator YiaG
MNKPGNNWKKIETEEEITIPTPNGKTTAKKIKIPAYQDPKTNEIYYDGKTIRTIDDEKARHLGLPTTKEIKLLRQRLGYSRPKMSQLLQLGANTWARWESGRERPSKPLNLLLRALAEGRINVPWLKAQHKPQGTTTKNLGRHP